MDELLLCKEAYNGALDMYCPSRMFEFIFFVKLKSESNNSQQFNFAPLQLQACSSWFLDPANLSSVQDLGIGIVMSSYLCAVLVPKAAGGGFSPQCNLEQLQDP